MKRTERPRMAMAVKTASTEAERQKDQLRRQNKEWQRIFDDKLPEPINHRENTLKLVRELRSKL